MKVRAGRFLVLMYVVEYEDLMAAAASECIKSVESANKNIRILSKVYEIK